MEAPHSSDEPRLDVALDLCVLPRPRGRVPTGPLGAIAQDRPQSAVRRDRVPETAFAVEFTLPTTRPPAEVVPCGRVHGRGGLRKVPRKSIRRAIRAPVEEGLELLSSIAGEGMADRDDFRCTECATAVVLDD